MYNTSPDRSTATAWAKQLLDRTDWVILDTETTCLKYAHLCDIGVLGADGEAALDNLCKPSIPITTDASAVHRIFDSDVVTAPTFSDLYPRVRDAIAGKEIIIYNAPFDIRVLNGECDRNGLPTLFPLETRVTCAMKAYSQWVGEWSEKKKGYKYQKLPGGTHRAIGDCRAVQEIIFKMADT